MARSLVDTQAIRDFAIEWAAGNGHGEPIGYVVVTGGRCVRVLTTLPPARDFCVGTHLVSLCGGVVQVAVGEIDADYASRWRTVFLDNAIATPGIIDQAAKILSPAEGPKGGGLVSMSLWVTLAFAAYGVVDLVRSAVANL